MARVILVLIAFVCSNAISFTQTWKTHRGKYINYFYGYSVVIPRGLVGIGPTPPSPQHGIRVDLSRKPEAFIWVEGSYNAADWANLDEALKVHLRLLTEEGKEITEATKTSLQLDKLQGVRSTVKYKSSASTDVMIQDLILAMRNEAGMFYTIGLITPQSRYYKDRKVLQRLISAWKQEPLGK